jgi:cytochrome c5
MKKLLRINSFLWLISLFVLAANLQIVSGQIKEDQTTPVPENINKIFQASCMDCHGSNGKILPRTKLDFSKWTEYDAAEKAKKAYNICSELTEGFMPPKSIRKSKPELIPTKEQIKLICKWADSLKLKEGEK